MRHHHRFSRPRSADEHFSSSEARASLHALWHAVVRQQRAWRGEAGGEGRDMGFGRHHGGRRNEQAFRGEEPGRGARREFAGGEQGRRGEREFRGAGFGRDNRQDFQPESQGERGLRGEGRGRHGRDRSERGIWQAGGRQHDPRGGGRGGRFGGGPGGFGGGGGPGGFGGDGDGFPRGRKFSSDDLQLLLMSMIDAQPSHGYELIKALETRSNGFYSPSPGMVYPALTYLEELGYVTVQLEGNRKRYELADAGRDYLTANRERVELMLARLAHIARKMDSVRRAFAGEEPADISEGGWAPELNEARRTLKQAMLRRDNAPAAEQRRIAEILMRAVKEIEGDGKSGDAVGEAE
ncbi:DNA-binding transcriptional regulator, PadR family [Paraburkholderia fungorum]|uniref:DNA-binding transcriptional regulator, PadR family n=1 Tax=Paraburkholderia fungorum TaxID=134537 RepID=A0A1H1I833_9BURK|nr:PadR family transcriptional regulator [Paraburkholderia fungorum]SDR33855.1 DNA-binding transcriptional regulator, PadR family [Paraburkholderia fungorum]